MTSVEQQALLWLAATLLALITSSRNLWRAHRALRRIRAEGIDGSALALATARRRRNVFAWLMAACAFAVVPVAMALDDDIALRMSWNRNLLLLLSVFQCAYNVIVDVDDGVIDSKIRSEGAVDGTG